MVFGPFSILSSNHGDSFNYKLKMIPVTMTWALYLPSLCGFWSIVIATTNMNAIMGEKRHRFIGWIIKEKTPLYWLSSSKFY